MSAQVVLHKSKFQLKPVKNLADWLVCFCFLFWTGINTSYAQADPEPKDYYHFRDSLIKIIDKENNTNQKAISIYNLVIASYEKENALAVKYTDQLQHLTQKINNKKAWADYFGAKGRCIFRSNYNSGKTEFEKAYQLYKELNDNYGQANMLTLIGICYNRTGAVDKAIKYFKDALDLSGQLKDSLLLNESYQNLGYVSEKIKDFDKSLFYNKEAIRYAKDFLDTLGAVNNIGIVYLKHLDQPGEAYKWFQPFIARVRQSPPSSPGAEYYLYLGWLYQKLQKTDSASYAFRSGIKAAYSVNDYQRLATGYYSEAALMAGANKIVNPQLAQHIIHSLDSSLYFARASDSKEEYIPVFTLYASTYDAINEKEKASQFKDSVIYYTGVIFNNRTAQEVHNEIAALQGQVKDQQIQILQKEQKLQTSELARQQLQKKIFIGGVLLMILVAIALVNRLLYTRRTRTQIQKERDRSDQLLLNILPATVAGELKEKGYARASHIQNVTVLFTDFKGFTQLSETLSAEELLEELNRYFKAFDELTVKLGIEKIKTIGDSYMAAGGLTEVDENSVINTVRLGLQMQDLIQTIEEEKRRQDKPWFEMRVGIHTGPVIAGIVGSKKFQYDIWGDTVNTASRMESSGTVNRVNISEATYRHIQNNPCFSFESRGKIEAKNKGAIEMYFVSWNDDGDKR